MKKKQKMNIKKILKKPVKVKKMPIQSNHYLLMSYHLNRKKLLRNITADVNCGIEYYLSGPYEFMRVAEDSIRSIDVSTTKVYKEHFYIPSNPERDFETVD